MEGMYCGTEGVLVIKMDKKGMYLELKYVYIHLLLSILMTSSTSYPKELYIQQTQNIRSTVGNY